MPNRACFISYRRNVSAFIARAVFQDLRAHQVDAFLDVESIGQGEFKSVIEAQIRSRPYFLPILSPTALDRCEAPDDLLLREFEAAVHANRRIVPLVTPDFDRNEIPARLPKPLATRFAALNTVTVDHEYFEPSMDRLRERFLKPVDEPDPPVEPALARDAERLLRIATAQPSIGPRALSAQKHFERALKAAATLPVQAVEEFEEGMDLLKGAEGASSLADDFDLMYVELQGRVHRETSEFARVSEQLRGKHDTLMSAIRRIR